MRALPRTGASVAPAVAMFAAVVVVAGDDEPPAPAGRRALPSVSPPTNPDLGYTGPTVVCRSFADPLHRRDTRTDTGAQAAYRRAMAYASGELAAAVAAQPEGRDPQRTTRRAHQPDTATESHRAAHVTVTPVGVHGRRGPTRQRLMPCMLRRDTGGWRVERYQVSDSPEPT